VTLICHSAIILHQVYSDIVKFCWMQCRHLTWITTQQINKPIICGTKVLCPQNLFLQKSQRYKGRMSRYVDMQHLCFWHRHLLYLSLTKSQYFSYDVNRTNTSIELLAINILYYMSWRSNMGLGIKSWKSGIPLRIHSGLMNCFNSHFSSFLWPIKISHFVQRWENARIITRYYQDLNFVKRWT